MFTRSVSPEQAPDKPTYLEVDFEKGDPVALNGKKLSPATLLVQLNKVGMQLSLFGLLQSCLRVLCCLRRSPGTLSLAERNLAGNQQTQPW